MYTERLSKYRDLLGLNVEFTKEELDTAYRNGIINNNDLNELANAFIFLRRYLKNLSNEKNKKNKENEINNGVNNGINNVVNNDKNNIKYKMKYDNNNYRNSYKNYNNSNYSNYSNNLNNQNNQNNHNNKSFRFNNYNNYNNENNELNQSNQFKFNNQNKKYIIKKNKMNEIENENNLNKTSNENDIRYVDNISNIISRMHNEITNKVQKDLHNIDFTLNNKSEDKENKSNVYESHVVRSVMRNSNGKLEGSIYKEINKNGKKFYEEKIFDGNDIHIKRRLPTGETVSFTKKKNGNKNYDNSEKLLLN